MLEKANPLAQPKPPVVFSSAVTSASMVMPHCTLTVAGVAVLMLTIWFRFVVRSTRSTLDGDCPLITVSGDQLCMMPRGRTVHPAPAAQLQTATTSWALAGVQVQTAGTVIEFDQF